jgi:hypothetical protein
MRKSEFQRCMEQLDDLGRELLAVCERFIEENPGSRLGVVTATYEVAQEQLRRFTAEEYGPPTGVEQKALVESLEMDVPF